MPPGTMKPRNRLTSSLLLPAPIFYRSLVNHYDRLNPQGKYQRVYVPLCGKAADLAWLYKRGDIYVVGSDICEDCGPLFMKENPDLDMCSRQVSLQDGSTVTLYEVCNALSG